jgi:hypothetical protein
MQPLPAYVKRPSSCWIFSEPASIPTSIRQGLEPVFAYHVPAPYTTGESFVPITSSAETAQYFSRFQLQGPGNVERKIDYWDRIFLTAQELMETADQDSAEYREKSAVMVDKLCRMVLGRDEYLLKLAHRYFCLEDLLEIRNRLVGSGYIGGKACGDAAGPKNTGFG